MRKTLKLFAVPAIYTMAVIMFVLSVYVVGRTISLNKLKNKVKTGYVSSEIVTDNEYIPVIYTEPTITRPYMAGNVTINKPFYNYQDETDRQKDAVVFYEDTYIQNSGVAYTSTESFDVVSILDGTVLEITNSEILGNTIKIKHNDNLISSYECLSDMTVKANDNVLRGQVIGKSGTCKLYNKDNNLHFEVAVDGKNIDPENSYDKAPSELQS